MAGAQMGAALQHIQWLFSEGSATGLSDTQLLSRFALRRDQAAFAAVVARHGPMVLAVCRAILRDPSDAEDAFQATFLVLARKAGSAWTDGQIGGWLHKVAYRIAIRASAETSRRRRHERHAAEEEVLEYTHVEFEDDLRPALHEEIARLPAKFRLPIVLCYLEGLTHAQAAVELQCGEATVRRRLAEARERLRIRLAHRGFAPIGSVLGASLAREAGAAVPMVCAQATIRAVMRVAAGEAMATVVSARVLSLTQGGLTMITNGWKAAAFAALSVAAIAGLAGVVGAGDDRRGAHAPDTAGSPVTVAARQPTLARVDPLVKPPAPAAENVREAAQENWPMSLAEALRIGMDNCAFLRVFAFSAQNLPTGGLAPPPGDGAGNDPQMRSARITIGPFQPDSSLWQFKAQVMAELRSVEQQYWNLSQAHVQLWSAEQALRLATEIHNREQAEVKVGRGTIANVAEAAQSLEQFNLALTTRTSDVITTERQFRKVLGLPLADYRRIVPVTRPTEELVDPNWDTCLAEMMEQQPEIVLNKLADAAVAMPSANLPGSTDRQRATVDNHGEDDQRQQRQKRFQQVVHQRTHDLARHFLEIDSNFKQYQTAKRLRTAASQRLDAQRAYFDERRVTVDRLLDAVSKYATALATEAQYKTTYNVAIIGLEEAKGTLLAHRGITVVEGPRNSISHDNRNPQPVAATFGGPTGLPIPATAAGPSAPTLAITSDVGAPTPTPIPAATAGPFPPARSMGPERNAIGPASKTTASAGKATPRVWTFSFSIGRERPFLIKGTISESADDQLDAPDH
jgi:RNA polymerase sigma factor (sigma-70 family)